MNGKKSEYEADHDWISVETQLELIHSIFSFKQCFLNFLTISKLYWHFQENFKIIQPYFPIIFQNFRKISKEFFQFFQKNLQIFHQPVLFHQLLFHQPQNDFFLIFPNFSNIFSKFFNKGRLVIERKQPKAAVPIFGLFFAKYSF